MISPQSSATQRILDAAIDLFGRQGVAATGIRAVAEQAGVSPALVLHHYRSKEGLREACDHHVVALMHARKTEAVRAGPQMPLSEFRAFMAQSRPTLRYLARALAQGSPRINAFVDDLVASAIVYTDEAVEAGLVRPSVDSRSRTIVLALWMFGGLVLHEHLERLLGVDLLDDAGDALPYVRTAMEILTQGVFVDTAYPQLREPTTERTS